MGGVRGGGGGGGEASSSAGGSEKPALVDERSPLLGRPSSDPADLQHRRQTFARRRTYALGFAAALPLLLAVLLLSYLRHRPGTPVLGGFESSDALAVKPRSVAIIGAGPAGIACALRLEQLADHAGYHINVTILEAADQVGGKLAVGAGVHPYDDAAQDPISAEDIAGSALLYENTRMRDAVEHTLQKQLHFTRSPSREIAYFDGREFVASDMQPVSEASWSVWVNQQLRYGPWTMHSARSLLDDAKAQVRLLSAGDLDGGIKAWLQQTGNADSAMLTAQVMFDANGLPLKYQREVLDPQIRRRLGRAPHRINSLQMAAALAAADAPGHTSDDELLGTLKDMAASLLGDLRLGSKVTGISRAKSWAGSSSGWAVDYLSQDSGELRSRHFDHVVVTSSDMAGLVRGDDATVEAVPSSPPVLVTFFATTGPLDPSIFGSSGVLPQQILFIESPELGPFQNVSEFSFVRPLVRADGPDSPGSDGYLYRVVTNGGNARDLLNLFNKHDTQGNGTVVDWSHSFQIEHGYPILDSRTNFPSFELRDDGLWGTWAIDSVGSSVDLSWMAGEAVAKRMMGQINPAR